MMATRTSEIIPAARFVIVIPAERQREPESITTKVAECAHIPSLRGYGFRARAFSAPRNDDVRNRSRGATASEVCDHDEAHDESLRMIPKSGVRFSDQDHAPRKKGGEAPKDACHPVSAPFLLLGGGVEAVHRRQACAVCATYLLAGTARLPALRCGACPGERTPGLSPGRASRETRCEGVTSA